MADTAQHIHDLVDERTHLRKLGDMLADKGGYVRIMNPDDWAENVPASFKPGILDLIRERHSAINAELDGLLGEDDGR